jgi:Aspartyl protease
MTFWILRIRPALFSALCALILFMPCSSARGEGVRLKSLYEEHRWFELRDFVEKHGAPAFYRGAVACAFNDLHRCETDFRGVFNVAPRSYEAIEAHRILASAYFTHGKYKKALAQVDALLALRPTDSDALSDRPVFAILARSPDLKFVGRHTTVEFREGGLPFSIDGVQATYWFDTGAELSVMSESEAKRFGLRIRSAPVKVGDVNGTQVDTRIAFVDELSIGSVRVKHVACLVLPDNQPPFNEGRPGSRGLIGLPVLLALDRFAFGADRKFEIRPASSNRSAPHADLCFDGKKPVVQIRYHHRSLAFTLDTGATNTDLYPPFAAAFPELVRSAVKTDSYKTEGVGGAKYMQAAILKSLKLSIGGFPVTLKSADVLLKPTTASSKFFDGNLGIEPYQQARKTTFDFQTMTLTLQ